MDLEKIKEITKGEPAFRLKQIKKAVFVDLIESWDQATTLPESLREKLARLSQAPAEQLQALKPPCYPYFKRC